MPPPGLCNTLPSMGAWGTGIFQDHTACDIRDDYKEFFGDGLSGPEATARILSEYKSSFADPDGSGPHGSPWPPFNGSTAARRNDTRASSPRHRFRFRSGQVGRFPRSRQAPCRPRNSAQRLLLPSRLKRRFASRFAHPAIGRSALSSPIASSPAISPFSTSSDFTVTKAEPFHSANCSIGQGPKCPRRKRFVQSR